MVVAMTLTHAAVHASTLSDPEVDGYNYRLSVQNIGGTYPDVAPTGRPLLDGANAVLAMGSRNYKFTMNSSSSGTTGYRIVLPPTITSLRSLAENEPQYRALFDLPGLKNYVFWCYSFANPNNYNWNNGLTEAAKTAEYNEIYELCQYLLTQYNGSGKSFYLGNWEGDWSIGVPEGGNGNPTPTRIQAMIDWANIRQKAVDDAKANTPHTNVNCYYYVEVNRVVDAFQNPPESNQRVINTVVPNIPNLDFVSWSSYDLQGRSAADIRFFLNYAESFLPTAKAASIPGKRLFIGEYGYGSDPFEVQVVKNQAYNQTLFDWGCPFSFYWELSDNGFEEDGVTERMFATIDRFGNPTALHWAYSYFLNAAKLEVLAFKQRNGRLPNDTEYAAIAHELLAGTLTAPVALSVNNLPAVVTSQESATLSGELTQGIYGGELARMYLCYGPSDGGTVEANWANVVDLGTNNQPGAVEFASTVGGLTPQATYHYRFFASNSGTTVWEPASASFFTSTVHTFTPTASGTFSWASAANWNAYGVPVSGTTSGVAIFPDTTTALSSGTRTIDSDPAALSLDAITLNGLGPAATGPATASVGTAGNTWTLSGSTVFLLGKNNNQPLTILVQPNIALGANTTFHGNGSAGFTFAGNITGGYSVVKSGTSTLTLSGSNTFSGGLQIREGTVAQATSTSAFGSGTILLGGTDGTAPATLAAMSAPTSFTNPVVVQPGGTGLLTIKGPGGGGSGNLTGNLSVNSAVTLDAGSSANSFLILKTGSLSGSGRITVYNAGNALGTVILQHPNSSGFTGSVAVENGTLRLSNASALNAANAVEVNAGAVLDIRNSVTIAGLNDSSGAGGTVINGASVTRTLTLGGTGSYSFHGVLTDGTSAGRTLALTKSGSGTQVLGGAGTFTGGTIVEGGILDVTSTNALGSGAVVITGSAGQFELGTSGTFANPITISGGDGVSAQGLIDTDVGVNAILSTGTITITAAPTIGNAGHFGASTGASLTVQSYINSLLTVDWRRSLGIFSGGGNYTNFRIRSGTVRLGAHNGLATGATVAIGANSGGGTLDLGGYNQTLVGIIKNNNSAAITNSGSTLSVLTLTGTSSYAGTITDGSAPVAVTVNGGALTLTATNTYSGTTSIQSGMLVLGTTGFLAGNSPIRIAPGATFNTTARSSHALSGSQPVTFQIDPAGSGSAGRINAAGLDISNAVAFFSISGTLDDPAYVLASYSGKTGSSFAAATPPAGYTIDYAYAGGTQIALVPGASNNANLFGLTLDGGNFSPAFSNSVTSYSTTVSSTTSSISISPVTADGNATVRVNGVVVASGNSSLPINLAVGANTITVDVTALDGTQKTYTLLVTRQASTNADLSALALSDGTLSPVFSGTTTSYTASVPYGVSTITATPTSADNAASITVNGLPVASGSPSAPISLAVGANVIPILVTAGDGLTTRTYTLTVNRSATSINYTFTQISAGTLAWTGTANWDANGVPVGGNTVSVTFFPETTTALGSGTYTINSDPPSLVLNTLVLNGLGASGTTASALVNIGSTSNVWTFDGTTPVVNLTGLKNVSKDLVYNVKPSFVLNQPLTFAGDGTAGSTANGFTFSGSISGSRSLTKTGASRLTLSGSNTYSGGTLLGGGQLWVNHANALGTGTVTLGGTARQLAVNSNVTLANPLVLGASTNAGTVAQGIVDAGNNTVQLTGPIAISATPQSGGHFGSNTGVLTIAGPVTASVPVTVRRGVVVFSGTASSYSRVVAAAGTIRLGAHHGLASAAVLEMATTSAASFDLAGFDQSLAGITRGGTSTAILTNSGTGSDSTLLLTGSSSFDGLLTDGTTRKLGLSVVGGPVILSGSNTYSGTTTILSGTLVLSGSGSLSNRTPIRIADGGKLDVSAKTSFAPGATQPIAFAINPAGSGRSGQIQASGLAIADTAVTFEVSAPLDDPVYVLATYTSLSGTGFASVTPPEGYYLDYQYAAGTQIALVADNLSSWRQTYFPGSTAETGPGADLATPMGDGIPNLVKFATGMDPTKPRKSPGLLSTDAGNLYLTYTPSAEAVADGVMFTVETSDTLGAGSWTSIGVSQGEIGGGGSPVTASVPLSPGTKRFLRLRITLP